MGTKAKLATLAIAINFALSENNEPPEWIELVPAGNFVGRDGRAFKNSTPQAVIDDIVKVGRDIPIDIEHSTELKGPKGEPAPAQSWVNHQAENFEVRDGAVWGKVDWTENGIQIIKNDEYRTYSPAFYVDPETGEIKGVKSIGFTNTANLSLTALNHEEESVMDDLPEAIAKALGLATNASEADAVLAISTLKEEKQTALNSAQTPDADKFIPKATYDLAINRAEKAEKKIEDSEKETLETAINAEVDAAIAAGKIAPANKDFYIASCQQDGGLDKFKAFAESAPVVITDTDLDDKDPSETTTALNAEEKAVALQLGISEEDFAKEKGTES